MNILPKKKWNVYNQKNIDRVKRDEREHQEKCEREKRRHEELEEEKRFKELNDQLKKKRKLKIGENNEEENREEDSLDEEHDDDDDNIPTVKIPPSELSISSLFEGIEDKIITYSNNSNSNNNNNKNKNNNNSNNGDNIKIDLNKISNSKLGEGSYEYKKEKPFWENNKKDDGINEKDYKDMDRKERKKLKREQWFKDKEDPINIVDKALGRESYSGKTKSSSSPSITTTTSSIPSTKKTIEQLRKERLEREQNERKKETILKNSVNKKEENCGENQNSFTNFKYNEGFLKKK